MGIILLVKEKTINTTYADWYDFRMEILKAFIKYIEESLILEKYKNIYIKDDLKNILNLYYSNINFEQKMDFLEFSSNFEDQDINTLITIKLYGIYVFINKTDFSGSYTVGNSYDILLSLKEIYYLVNTNWRSLLDDVINLFEYSYIEKKNMIIC
jgi:hypothetical protein